MPEPGPDAARHSGATFARLLARHRRAARLTQEELAAASGISARAISDMERGRVRGPQHRTVQALANALTLDEATLWEFLRIAKAGRVRTGGQRPGQPADLPADPTGAAGARGEERRVELCELPPEVADFTGRESELARVVDQVDAQERANRRAAAVITVFGPPGVGKTSFAVHAGHRLAGRYADGCLFLDLRGMEEHPVPPAQALGRLLLCLGLAETQLPGGTDERASLYRALLRDRRMLLVLDNAPDEAHVRPLLPSSPGCLVLVTSRRVLSGLESVTRMPLEVLNPADGVALLAAIVEERRVRTEPDAALRLVELCGCLPLALRIAGNRLASRPRWNLASLVHQLSDRQHRLTALTAGDLQVRTAFEVSYLQCDEFTRRLFRRLSLVTGPDVTVELAAVLGEVDTATAARGLEELVDASLLDSTAAEGRYTLHDLLRLFAGERLAEEEPGDRVCRAQHRLTGWVLGTGVRAGLLLWPSGTRPGVPAPAGPDPVTTPEQAVRWLDTERGHWLATLRHASRTGRHADVLAFSRAMHWYSDLRPTGDLWREVFTYGVSAARALGSRRDEAAQLNFLGWALNRIHGLHREALRTHRGALAAAREAGDRREEAWALQYCGRVELDLGRPARAAGLFGPAIALFVELDDPFGAHTAMSFLGMTLHALGRSGPAARTHRRAVAYFRRSDTVAHRNLLSLCLLRLADTLAATSDWEAAYATYREAGAVAVRVHACLVEGLAWFGCGEARAATGQTDSAVQHLDVALTVFADLDERWLQARVLHRMASLVEEVEGPGAARARAYRERALQVCAHLTEPRTRPGGPLTAEFATTHGAPTI